MENYRWVQYNNLSQPVSINGCPIIAIFIKNVKDEFSNQLKNVDASQIILLSADKESNFNRSWSVDELPVNSEDTAYHVEIIKIGTLPS